MKEEYSVIFKGFKTKEQAEAFASWYEGQGEQDFPYWGENQDPPFTAYTDGKKGYYKQLDNGDVEVYVKVEEN